MKRAVAVGAAAGLAAAVVAVVLLRTGGTEPTSWPVPGDRGAPRLQVEVLNGSGIDGLARAATARLRRAGIDVVFFGTAAAETDSTRLVVRRGDSTVADVVRRALGVGRIVVEPDPRLLLDVSVILGGDAAGVGRDP